MARKKRYNIQKKKLTRAEAARAKWIRALARKIVNAELARWGEKLQ